MSAKNGTRVSEEDMPLLAKVIDRYRQAQMLGARAQQLANAAELDAEELHARYELDVAAGDVINEDGTIRRAT